MKLKERFAVVLLFVFCVLSAISPAVSEAQMSGINVTKHNLSVTGPGEIRALAGADPLQRICIFCHTPHNAAPRTPLWNRAVGSTNYELYTSTTMGATPSQPLGPSRLCLSCHDGALALGAVLRPERGIEVTRQITVERPSYIGTILTDDHPFSFSYEDSIGNPYAGLSPTPPPELVFFGPMRSLECSSCHDAHEDRFTSADIRGHLTGKFLRLDNRNSGLCTRCHSTIDGWNLTTHRTTGLPVIGRLPVPPKEWPAWSTVAEWGCEGCHISHAAGGPKRLLYYQEEERNCYTCHDGTVAVKNIDTQFQKESRHPVEATMDIHDPRESATMISNRHVECADCHNSHAVNNGTAVAPNVSGRLEKIAGMTIDRAEANPALYEYQICFKCHADLVQRIPLIPRVINDTNAQSEFNPISPSYHPVTGIGRNPDVPSIPSTFEPTLTASSIIYCTSCHSDDGGVSRGPHGSSYSPILRDQYETIDGTPESFQSYALCYRCHNRDRLLTSVVANQSFKQVLVGGVLKGGHLGHLAAGAPCSVCHDPHGIADDGLSGSHTHLINFDSRTVLPVSLTPPNNIPRFNDTGLFSGSCNLVCHGKTHSNLSYP